MAELVCRAQLRTLRHGMPTELIIVIVLDVSPCQLRSRLAACASGHSLG